MAVRKRRLVPELARFSEADRAGIRPEQPDTLIVAALASCSTSIPKALIAAIMTRVSSQSSAPVKTLGPSARAAIGRARFVRLFEPGTRTTRDGGGPRHGSINICAG